MAQGFLTILFQETGRQRRPLPYMYQKNQLTGVFVFPYVAQYNIPERRMKTTFDRHLIHLTKKAFPANPESPDQRKATPRQQ